MWRVLSKTGVTAGRVNVESSTDELHEEAKRRMNMRGERNLMTTLKRLMLKSWVLAAVVAGVLTCAQSASAAPNGKICSTITSGGCGSSCVQYIEVAEDGSFVYFTSTNVRSRDTHICATGQPTDTCEMVSVECGRQNNAVNDRALVPCDYRTSSGNPIYSYSCD